MVQFRHRSEALDDNWQLIYLATSKINFCHRQTISVFVVRQKAVPLNPFQIFDYYLGDRVERDLVRTANNSIVRRCDEVWVFGEISDGVMAEIKLAYAMGKPVRYFDISSLPHQVVEVSLADLPFDADTEPYRQELLALAAA